MIFRAFILIFEEIKLFLIWYSNVLPLTSTFLAPFIWFHIHVFTLIDVKIFWLERNFVVDYQLSIFVHSLIPWVIVRNWVENMSFTWRLSEMEFEYRLQSHVKKGVCWAIFGCAVSLQKDKTRPPVAGDRPSSTVRWHRGTNSHFFKRCRKIVLQHCLSNLDKKEINFQWLQF